MMDRSVVYLSLGTHDCPFWGLLCPPPVTATTSLECSTLCYLIHNFLYPQILCALSIVAQSDAHQPYASGKASRLPQLTAGVRLVIQASRTNATSRRPKRTKASIQPMVS